MMNVVKVPIGNGQFIEVVSSKEDASAVPDVTKDAGPDEMKLLEDAKKPVSDKNAEYDAADNVDKPDDVEKANENTFFGVILKHRSIEAFAKTKTSFASAADFFKSNEIKQAIAAARQWAEKKKLSFASSGDFPEKSRKLGFSPKVVDGALLSYLEEKNKLYIDIVFKDAKGKIKQKNFAAVKIGGGQKSSSADSASPTRVRKPAAKSKVNRILKGKESDDPVDEAFKEADPEPVAAPAVEPAETDDAPPPATTPAPAPEAPPAEDGAPLPEVGDITEEEIEEESKSTESFIGAVTKILQSREEADAAASEIDDAAIDDVVGDGEGDTIEEGTGEAEGADGAGEAEELSEEEKAVEAFIQSMM
jgi:hypothetical protein